MNDFGNFIMNSSSSTCEEGAEEDDANSFNRSEELIFFVPFSLLAA
jgi:hypothetical protein